MENVVSEHLINIFSLESKKPMIELNSEIESQLNEYKYLELDKTKNWKKSYDSVLVMKKI